MKKFCIFALCLGLMAPIMARAARHKLFARHAHRRNLKSSGLEIQPRSFMEGLKDVLGGKATKYTDAQAQAAVQASFFRPSRRRRAPKTLRRGRHS